MTAINKLRERVKIYENTYISDGMGGGIETTTFVKSVWARVEMQGGSRLEEGKLITTKPVIITMRVGDYQLTTENIIRYNDRDYTVSSITFDERNRFTTVVASGGKIFEIEYVTHSGEVVTHNGENVTHNN